MGRGDPCVRVEGPERARLALAGPAGTVGLDVQRDGGELTVRVEGPGADAWVPALPGLLGLEFRPPTLDGPRVVRELGRRFAGLRLPRVPFVFTRLVQVVLQQLVPYADACDGWRALVRARGERLPFEGGERGEPELIAPPTARVLARMAPHDFLALGILPQHGRRIAGLARVAHRIEEAWDGGRGPDAVERTCALLERQPGVGPWTLGYLRGSALGDADAVVPRDLGFPRRVAYVLERRERADDDDMLRLLEPFRPYRFYVLCLLLKGASPPPRRGPRPRRVRDRLQPPRRS